MPLPPAEHRQQPQQPNRAPRRPRVLLGVTGSIAAVKGPRLAVRLATELGADVKLLLSRGAENFWSEDDDGGGVAKRYDPVGWEDFHALLLKGRSQSGGGDGGEEKNIGNGDNGGSIEAEDAGVDDGEDVTTFTERGQLTEGRKEGENVEIDWAATNGSVSLYSSDEEWKGYEKLGDPVLHIDLRNWADVCVVAPLSAHTLAKIANGMCDDVLTCCLRAWDYGHHHGGVGGVGRRRGKPVVLAPAMNTAMWEHPLTRTQLRTIQGFCNASSVDEGGDAINGVTIVSPAVKTLACGEVGAGALAELDDVLEAVRASLGLGKNNHVNDDAEAEMNGGVANLSENEDSGDFKQTATNAGIAANDDKSATITESGQRTSVPRKDIIRRAILQAAKDRFRELQSQHKGRRVDQHQSQQDSVIVRPNGTSGDGKGGPTGRTATSNGNYTLAAPISPTPDRIIESFLPHLLPERTSPSHSSLSAADDNDQRQTLLIDIGCGDGRWLLAAALSSPHCHCIGIDVDDDRLALARSSIDRYSCHGNSGGDLLSDRVQLHRRDAFEFAREDEALDGADAIVLYLFREAMAEIAGVLRRRLEERPEEKQRRPVRILSVGFALPGWTPFMEGKRDGIRVYLYSSEDNLDSVVTT